MERRTPDWSWDRLIIIDAYLVGRHQCLLKEKPKNSRHLIAGCSADSVSPERHSISQTPKKEKLKARTPSQFFFPPQISRLAFYIVFNTLMHVQVFIICLVWF